MTTDLQDRPQKRKVLSLKIEKEGLKEPCFVENAQSVFMVWRVGGDMPKRVYGHKEGSIAKSHAKTLALETGEQFHVLRSYRAFIPEAKL